MGIGCVSRRSVLGAAAAGIGVAGLLGCGRTEWYPSDVTPDEYVLRAVIREKERMVTRYEAVLAEGSGPQELLEQLLEHHLAHLDALVDALPEDAPSPSPVDGAGELPAEESALDAVRDVTGLRVLEAAATSARLDQAGAVTDPGLAQLVSGIGACEAGHTYLLARA